MSANTYQEIFRESALSSMRSLGFEPDPWQMDVLTGGQQQLLLNCSRQAGKSTTVAVLSVLETVARAGMRVLLLAPSLRQSRPLVRRPAEFLRRLGADV